MRLLEGFPFNRKGNHAIFQLTGVFSHLISNVFLLAGMG